MAIETQTAAVQLVLRQKCGIASKVMQRFSQDASAITAAQAVAVDAALVALQSALVAAGAGPVLPSTQKTLSSGVKASVGTVTGSGTFGTPTIVGGVITGIVLSAS